MSRSQHSDDPIRILVAEDDPDDRQLIAEAFESIDRETVPHAVSNGYEALYFLRRRGADESAPLPDLALVDLDLPGKDGCDIVEAIRKDPQLRRLPVIVLTNSTDSDDVTRCYDAQVNAYVMKPTEPDEFVSLAEVITRFWFERAQLPSGPE